MGRYYEKDVGNGEKLLYDSSGKCIGRGVTDKSGKTIYSGEGGCVGKSYETGHGTVKYFDSEGKAAGGGIKRSGVSAIVGEDKSEIASVGTVNAGGSSWGETVSVGNGNRVVRRLDKFEFKGEEYTFPQAVTLSNLGKTKLFTDLSYATLVEGWENAAGRLIYKYKVVNRLGYYMNQESRLSPDELVAEMGIDYSKANVSELTKYPAEERNFHLMMYDSVINNRSADYYLKKQQNKKALENAVLAAAALLFAISLLVWLFC